MYRLSDERRGYFDFAPRFRVTRVVYRLLGVLDDNAINTVLDHLLRHCTSFSARLTMIEMVGHQESVGHRLVNDVAAADFEARFARDVAALPSHELVDEWDLLRVLWRAASWGDQADRALLASLIDL